MADGSDCCGTSICDAGFCFEDFLCLVKRLYPDFQGRLCEDGVFDRLVGALVKPLYDAYLRTCGICDIEVESNPMTACCTVDRWYDEYGINDLCLTPDYCISEEQQVEVLTRRAHLRARVLIEYNGLPNAAFFENIAEMFGLQIEVHAPTLLDGVTRACDTYTAWKGTQPRFGGGTLTRGLPMTAHPSQCLRLPHQFIIKITCAPQPIINHVNCGRIGQPISVNPFVDAFKCLVGQYKPTHVAVCFLDDWTTNPCAEHENPCSPPVDLEPCPREPRGCPGDIRCS